MQKTCSSFISRLYLAVLGINAAVIWYIFMLADKCDLEQGIYALELSLLAFVILWTVGWYVDLLQ